jgi:hypothetical protein
MRELHLRLIESGCVTAALMSEFETLYADPRYWTSVISLIANSGRAAKIPR